MGISFRLLWTGYLSLYRLGKPIDELDPQVLIVRHKGQHHD